MSGILTLLARHRDADCVFESSERETIDALTLLGQAQRFCWGLQALSTSSQVLLISDDRREFTVAMVGTWLAQRAVALAPNGQSGLLREWTQRHPQVTLVGQMAEVPAHTVAEVIAAAADRRVDSQAVRTQLAAISDDPARVLVTVWTSGTTGDHQAHQKTVIQLLGEAGLHGDRLGFAAAEVVVSSVPAHHIYGLLFGILLPLLSGGIIAAGTPVLPQEVAAGLAGRDRVSLVSVPAHLRALAILPRGALTRARRVISSSAPLPASIAQTVSTELGANVIEIFGSTETGGIGWRSAWPLEQPWQVLEGVEVRCDHEGLMLVDSPFIDAAVPRPWRAADRIEMRGADHFIHQGREDGVIKVAGKRVSLGEIQTRLLQISGVLDAAVVALAADEARGHEVGAVVVAPGKSPTELRRELQVWLDPVVIPRRFRFVDALPHATMGKIPREALLHLFALPITETTTLRVLTQHLAGETVLGRIHVPHDMKYFHGHFRDYPIVAAFVQLDFLDHLIRASFADGSSWGALHQILRLKFKRPLRPGDQVDYELIRRTADTVDFALKVNTHLAAQGTLRFEVSR